MVHPLVGKKAPSVTLKDANGQDFTIQPAQSGLPLVIFFYPQSGTYGCNREACSFRDAIQGNDLFKRSKCEVVGISGQDVAKQKSFVDEHGLPYPILSDSEGVARKAYQVNKGLLGFSEARLTFFIDPSGTVKATYDSVLNFNAHAKFVEKLLAEEEKQAKPTATETAAAAKPAAT